MSAARIDKGDPPLAPEIDIREADKWVPTNARLICMAERHKEMNRVHVKYYKIWREVYATIGKHKREYQGAKKKRISKEDALKLAKRIKTLCLDKRFSGPDDWRAFLTGQCLTLKPAGGPVRGCEFASADVMLLPNPGWRKGKVSFPAELVSAFGVQTSAWLNARLESVWREFVARVAGESSSRSGDFGFVLNRSPRPKPEPGSILLLVPAPDEERIADSASRAPTKIDHWEALARAAEILRRYRQPLGDAMSDWAVAVLKKPSLKPKGSTRKQAADHELRNLVLNEVVCVLVDCGLRKAGESSDTRVSACGIAAEVFEIGRGGDWNAVSKAIENRARGNLF